MGRMNDLIEKQAAIDALVTPRVCDVYDSYWNGRNTQYQEDIDAINALPSAQPETAKRIVGMSKGGMTMWYQCDMCHEPVDEKDAFCRGCGRRLVDE